MDNRAAQEDRAAIRNDATHPADPAAPARVLSRLPSKVPAVRRAIAILTYLAEQPGGAGLARISRDLDIIPSTCLHILRELAITRLVVVQQNGKLYSLGSGLLALTGRIDRHRVFLQATQPVLDRLTRIFPVYATASELDGADYITVIATSRTDASSLHIDLGNRVPSLSSASGRLVAAAATWGADETRRRFELVRWQSPPDYDTWLAEVAAARANGYAIDDGRFFRGVTIVAAPIHAPGGRPTHFLAVGAISEQLARPCPDELIRAVCAAAAELSSSLQ